MAAQYQEQDTKQHVEYEEESQEDLNVRPVFDWKKYIKTVCKVGVVLGLCGYGISFLSDVVSYHHSSDNNIIEIEDIQQGDGIIDSTLTNEFTLNGEYYSFPCKLQDLIDNGWDFSKYSDVTEKNTIKKNDRKYADLINDKDQSVFLALESLTGKKVSVKDSYAVYLSPMDPYEGEKVELHISGGIYTGMTCSELDELIAQNEWKYSKSTTNADWYYTIEYSEDDMPYEISYSISTKKENEVRYVESITINAYENYDYKK